MSATLPPQDPLFALARAILFRMDPERAHDLTLATLARAPVRTWITRKYAVRGSIPEQSNRLDNSAQTDVECMGLSFSNRVGLAAGLDKNGDYIDALGALGFGCLEIGTVTPKPQPGNPRPRLFRLSDQGAMINRMGFNNHGVDHLVRQVEHRRYTGRLGINIGKNASTALDDAEADYRTCLQRVYAVADYVTVNVSSPNTQGLRELQHGARLHALLNSLKNCQSQLATQHGCYTPLVIKISPDMTDRELDAFCSTATEFEVDGIIVCNTTRQRPIPGKCQASDEAGGLSGQPLLELANEQLTKVGTRLASRLAVIGVGGISCGQHATDKLALGADLIQLYSGLIFHGPALVRDCVQETQ